MCVLSSHDSEKGVGDEGDLQKWDVPGGKNVEIPLMTGDPDNLKH